MMRDFDSLQQADAVKGEGDAGSDGVENSPAGLTDGFEPEPFELGGLLMEDETDDFDGDGNRNNGHNGSGGDDELQAGDRSTVGLSNGHQRRFGRVDTPLRVEPPPSFNAPARPVEQTQEQQIKASAFSPAAFTIRKNELPSYGVVSGKESSGGMSAASLASSMRQRQDSSVRGHSENQASYRTAMSDYHMLAFSSQRSGRHGMEGLAYYSAGVTMDSMGQHGKALESYKKFHAVCRTLKDPLTEGLCHNCMGVDYMLMACPPGSNRQGSIGGLPQRSVSAVEKALEHHEAHLKVADDAGASVAHSNIGICYGLLGDYPRAAKHHQEALRAALRVQSASAQSVAVGNLGTLAMRQGDTETAAACLEQHLHLVQQLGDWQGEINAWSKMAELAAAGARAPGGGGSGPGGVSDGVDGAGEKGRNAGGTCCSLGAGGNGSMARALQCFEKAAALAKAHAEVSTLKRLHCDMGVVRGNASMDGYFQALRETAANGSGC